ncbi:MAG TPA: carboxypeptidase-like regulatory domain-containing protein [Candidatus Solibacter sp.]|nr:carboxypeptidase-like regulatory domain-containing protein [Candidatus Solibacter sp.]
MKRVLILVTLVLLALTLAPSPALAQQSKGKSTLTGVVIGPDDKPAAHATISYQYSDGSGPHSTHADAHGRFTITKLRASSYDIRASAKGVFSDWERNIPLRKGQTRSLELRLIYAKEMPKSTSGKKPK